MDKYLGIELDRFGFTIDSAHVYVSLSWTTLAVLALSVLGAKIYKQTKKGRK